MTVNIICVGNETVCDDGAGVRVGRVLRDLELPENVQVNLQRTIGLELIDSLEPDMELVLVDATSTGAEPGSCTVLELDATIDLASTPYCCHGIGLAEVLEVAHRVAPENLPCKVTLVGIEAAVLDRFGTALSPTVEEAIPEGVRAVLELVGASTPLVDQGVAEARARRGFEPDITETIT